MRIRILVAGTMLTAATVVGIGAGPALAGAGQAVAPQTSPVGTYQAYLIYRRGVKMASLTLTAAHHYKLTCVLSHERDSRWKEKSGALTLTERIPSRIGAVFTISVSSNGLGSATDPGSFTITRGDIHTHTSSGTWYAVRSADPVTNCSD